MEGSSLCLQSNLNFYDYLHRLTLDRNTQTVEIVEGGGQIVHFEDSGEFYIAWGPDGDEATFHFKNFRMQPRLFIANLKIQRGLFVKKDAKVFRHAPDRFYIFDKKYVFDRDPLQLGTFGDNPGRFRNMRFMQEEDIFHEDNLIYFDMYDIIKTQSTWESLTEDEKLQVEKDDIQWRLKLECPF